LFLKYRLSTLAEVRALASVDSLTAFDVETKGFYGKILLAQFYQADWEEALLVPMPEIIELQSLLKTLHIVCHNTSYEVSTVQAQLGATFGQPCYPFCPPRWDDTLLLAKLRFFDQEHYALDDCYKYAFKCDPYEVYNLDKKTMQKADFSKLDEPKMQYASIDVFYLLDLYKACEAVVETSNYQLDVAATTRAFQFQTNGVHINKARIATQRAAHVARIAELAVPINVNSWQQVRPYIGEEESDGLALATFALAGNERAAVVQETRKAIKQISFLDKFVKLSYKDRIYGKFTFTTKSGRGNCKDQNLQQLPRKTKECFDAEEGSVLVYSDYSQLELRYAAGFTGEPAMVAMFRAGDDVHQLTADNMNVSRQYAKTCNFNLLYLGSANMLRSIFIKDCNLLLPIDEVRALKNKWHKLWKVLTAAQDETVDRWRAGEHFETALGRRFKSKLYTDAMNLPISGGSAEIAKLAMHKMFKAIELDKVLAAKVKLCNFIHDSFTWECPNDPAVYKPLASIVAAAMQEAWNELICYTKVPDLPMPVQVLVGLNWGDLEAKTEEPIYKLVLE